jgi:hypothetical protein
MVAPPISKHEIIDVQLSYDMVGYDGIENLVYRTLSKVRRLSHPTTVHNSISFRPPFFSFSGDGAGRWRRIDPQ